ncbi:hypothetical protein [Dermacoccus nishinomiyaensis]|uniref:hypothetical protein n=1 Tax=Dermacoccus nishinomiyaensis TaxID=1274 RepID=UPI001EF3FAC9|nr:hypothetical protein [Dermacoccus nishinomiyaensis]MCG7430853.1 hypothetical protein [Dermacoccus nishinomiyaensis]
MTMIEMLDRSRAAEERESAIARLRQLVGTDDRQELREMFIRGVLNRDESTTVDRLRTLDYLLDGS